MMNSEFRFTSSHNRLELHARHNGALTFAELIGWNLIVRTVCYILGQTVGSTQTLSQRRPRIGWIEFKF